MLKKAEYELSQVTEKENTRKISLKNLIQTDFYLLFLFTLFFSIIGVTIFVGCFKFQTKINSGTKDIENIIQTIKEFINHIPSNFSHWINERTNTIDNVTNDIVTYAVLTPAKFINTTVNQIIYPTTVNIKLHIDPIDIPEIYLENLNLNIPIDEFIQVLNLILNIPFYFGLGCLVLSIILITLCLGKAIMLVLDYQSRIFKISFWIGLIFGLLFVILTFCILYIYILYINNVGNKIEEIQNYIEGNITIYNDFLDQNEIIVSAFISDQLNFLVNTTNQLVEQLRDVIMDHLNPILSNPLLIIFDKLDLVNIMISLDNFKINSKSLNLLWINEIIHNIFISFIVSSTFTSLFFIFLSIISYKNK
jgi:hypothetical protein